MRAIKVTNAMKLLPKTHLAHIQKQIQAINQFFKEKFDSFYQQTISSYP